MQDAHEGIGNLRQRLTHGTSALQINLLPDYCTVGEESLLTQFQAHRTVVCHFFPFGASTPTTAPLTLLTDTPTDTTIILLLE